MLCMVLGLLLAWGVTSGRFGGLHSCSWLLLGMGSDGRYALTGALVCGDLRNDCGDFP